MGSARRAFGGTNVVVSCQIASRIHSDSIQVPFIALPQASRASERETREKRERGRETEREREKRERRHRRERERNKRERETTKVTHK